MHHAACAVLFQEGKILLGKRSAHKRICPGQWDLIGGHVEAGETTDQALARELLEELGITTTDFAAFRLIAEASPAMGGPAIFNLYLVKSWLGEITMLGGEHSELRWFPIAEAVSLSDVAHPEYPRIFADIYRDPGIAKS